ncbi:MAG: transglutaminase family protein [Pseudomonadota bacterium]
MLFSISHQTRYKFSGPVFLEPHLLKLHPRSDSWQKLLSLHIRIDPQPSGFSDITDVEGNIARWVWFDEMTESLDISVESEVRTFRDNPYDYILASPSFQTHPFQYPEELVPSLHAYLDQDCFQGGVGIRNLTTLILEKSRGDIFSFLNELNAHLYTNWQVTVREEGDPLPPDATLRQKEVSCRDLALLFIAVCRNAGIAGRFVSGYQEGDPDSEDWQLHAWCEVFIPGGGWRGYDPTHGLAVADRHIALAASHLPPGASPCTGTFRGTGARVAMTFSINIHAESGERNIG